MLSYTRTRLIVVFVFFTCVVVAAVKFGPRSKAQDSPQGGPTMTATMTAAPTTDVGTNGAFVNPGDTLRYSAILTNGPNGTAATGVIFTDNLTDANLSLVAGSIKATPIAFDDLYPVTGNVRIQKPAGTLTANDIRPVTGTNAGLTVTAVVKSSTACTGGCTNNVDIAADGSFKYNPPPGFEGTGAAGDSFTYTITDTDGLTATGTVKLDVSGMIWFVNTNTGVPACTTIAAGCGRLTNPFSDFASFAAANVGGGSNPDINDNIFLYNSTNNYVGGLLLRNGQKLIGQGASSPLTGAGSITGITPAADSDALPTTTAGTRPTITSAASGITVASGNTVRGITIGNVAAGVAFKLGGVSFGTLTVGDSASPDVQLTGTGRALDFTTGNFAASSAFIDITSTSSGMHGINLNGVGGTVSFGNTTISNSSLQGINITGSSVNATFGNTSVGTAAANSGGNESIRLATNTGMATFGTITIQNGPGAGFVTDNGGKIQVNGATTISTMVNRGIWIQNQVAANTVVFGNVSVTATGNPAVHLATNASSVTFADLSIAPNTNAIAFADINSPGLVTSTSGTVTALGAESILVTSSSLAMVLNSVTGNGAGPAFVPSINLTTATGSIVMNGGTLTGHANFAPFYVSGGTVSATYGGNINQANNSAAVAIDGGHATGTVTFQTGTINATNGTGLQFDNADGIYNFNGTTTLNGGDAGIDIVNGSGGTFTFGTNTSITNPSGIAYREDTSTPTVTYNGTITKTNGAQNAVKVNAKTGGTTTFAKATGGQITATTTTANAIDLTNTGGTVTFTGGMALTTTSGVGFNATGAGATVNATQNNTSIVNTIASTTGTALNVANTTIGGSGLTFRSISATSGPTNGIILNNTGTAAGNGGLTVTGNGSTCTIATSTCDGGSIQGSTGTGISLTSTKNVSLARMKIQNSGTANGAAEHEIGATTVNGFSISDSVITDAAGDVGFDDGINLTNTSGAVSLVNVAISGARHQGLTIDNLNTNMASFLMTGSTITGTPGGDGMLMQMRGASTLTAGTIGGATAPLGNTFSSNSATGLQISNSSSGPGNNGNIASLNVQNNTVTGNNAGMDFDISQSSSMTFVAQDNTFNNQTFQSINLFSDTGSTGGSMTATLRNNTIGTLGVQDSGSKKNGNGIYIHLNGGDAGSVTVDGNTIQEVPNASLLSVEYQAYGAGNTMKLKVVNNVLKKPTAGTANGFCGPANTVCPSSTFGMFVDSNNAGVFSTICSTISGNSVFDPTSGPNGAGLAAFQVGVRTAGNSLKIEGTQANIRSQIITTNTITNPGGSSSSSDVFVDSGTPTVVGVGSCGAFPAFAEPGVDIARIGDFGFQSLDGLRQKSCQPVSRSVETLSPFTGVASLYVETASVEVQIPSNNGQTATDYAQTATGSAQTATEYGQTATDNGPMASVLGETAYAEVIRVTANESWSSVFKIMAEIAERTASEIAPTVYSQGITPEVPETGTVTVNGTGTGFTIPAGKSTTIFFDAVIAKPTTPVNTFSVSTQGSVAGNFATFATDGDPATAGAQPTTTTIIQPPVITKAFNPTLVFPNSPSTLTFTITNANPAQTASQITFTDNFPAGLVVANPVVTTNTCAGAGTFTNGAGGAIAAGDTSVKLATGAATLAANGGSCTASVKVSAPTAGTAYPNTTGIIQSFEGFTGATSNTATLNTSALTAAGVTVSGRVLGPGGRGLTNAVVSLTDAQGVSRRAVTTTYGAYSFTDVEVGQTYVISVGSKRYHYTPKILTIMDELTDVNFTAEPY